MVRRVRSHRGRFRRDPESESPEKHTTDEGSISPDLGLNRERLQDAFGNSADLVMRELRIGDRGTIAVLVVHIDGLADKRLVSQSVIDQITGPISTCVDPVKAYFELRDRVLSSSGIAEVHCMDEFLGRVVGGRLWGSRPWRGQRSCLRHKGLGEARRRGANDRIHYPGAEGRVH